LQLFTAIAKWRDFPFRRGLWILVLDLFSSRAMLWS
jgi:hypothetical protein